MASRRPVRPRPDTNKTASSYDDGPAEGGNMGGEHHVEHRVYIVNRAGTGEAVYLLLNESETDIISYRPHREEWAQTRDITHFGVVAFRHYLFILGGFDRVTARHLNRVWRYDLSEFSWLECAPMALPRAKFGVCLYRGKIHVTGGERSDGRVTGSTEVYDPETNSWSKGAMLPSPRANHACAARDGVMLCAGGDFGKQCHSDIWVYERQKWGELNPDTSVCLPVPLDRFALLAEGNTFYFIGGVTSKSISMQSDPWFSTQRTVFSLTVKPRAPTPDLLTSDPRGLTSTSNTQRSSGKQLLSTPQPLSVSARPRFNMKLPMMGHARHGAGAILLGSKLYVVGGSTLDTGQPVTIAEYLDLNTGDWEEDFQLRKGDVSNVVCLKVAIPKVPVGERRKILERLRWVMW